MNKDWETSWTIWVFCMLLRREAKSQTSLSLHRKEYNIHIKKMWNVHGSNCLLCHYNAINGWKEKSHDKCIWKKMDLVSRKFDCWLLASCRGECCFLMVNESITYRTKERIQILGLQQTDWQTIETQLRFQVRTLPSIIWLARDWCRRIIFNKLY